MPPKKPTTKLATPPPRRPSPRPPVAAQAVSKPAPRLRRRRKSTPIASNLIYMAIIIGLLFGLLPTALVLVIGGLPTLVAVVVDGHRRHHLARCVGFLNFAGVAPYLAKIWMNHTVLAAMRMLTDPFVWLVMYGAAALGWIIYLSAPSIAWMQVELTGSRRIKILKARQHQLIAEWGEEVAGAAAQPTPAAGT